MCGIIGTLGGNDITKGLNAIKHRGLDGSNIIKFNKVLFGHNRLSILDLNSRSNQPFIFNNLRLIYNGELWNYEELKQELIKKEYTFKTDSDTEVVAISLYEWGIEALNKFNGMFALAYSTDGENIYLARDRFGEIPLYYSNIYPYYFCSELKGLKEYNINKNNITEVKAGQYIILSKDNIIVKQYYDLNIKSLINETKSIAKQKIYNYLNKGIEERLIGDVPICTLLSGGIDSAIITYFLKQYNPNIVAYTAVYDEKSKDLKLARCFARLLDIKLVEVKINLPSEEDLKEVIKIIEMPYKAQIEIGWACLKLSERIKEDGFKIVFSGEGSDELWASYGFAYHGIQEKGWYQYRKELFLSQQRKNFIRCNKIFMKNQIECRLPFLNKHLVEYALSLPQEIVQETKSKPKAILQEAFRDILPEEIVNRRKVAFQDGMKLKDAISLANPNIKQFYNSTYKNIYN